jgi:hypothetical protein
MDWLRITREILTPDLHGARLQILGLDIDDPLVIPGSTALGPSLAQMRELVTDGQAEGTVRNCYGKRDNAGTLRRVAPEPVLFPVLLNGDARLRTVAAGGVERHARGPCAQPSGRAGQAVRRLTTFTHSQENP